MRKYNFKLANDETWFLITEKTLLEVKQEILSNKWIKLSSYGWKSINNGCTFLPKESDIQTCNIVYVNEEINHQKIINEQKLSKKDRLEIIREIESYEFNLRMRWWYSWNVIFSSWIFMLNEELEHPLLTFNKEYLNEILSRCKKFNCRKKFEV